jgi:Tol biopolymer transport system component
MTRSRWFGVPAIWIALALVACLVVSTALAWQASSTAASAADPDAPLPGLIVFGRDDGDGGKFFVIHPDGTGERFLVDDIAGCLMCGEWSPDGSRMMFAALTPDQRVTTGTIQADGTGQFVLPISDPTLHLAPGSWAPDGVHMAFDGWDDSDPARRGAYIGAADGSATPRLVTADSGAEVVFGFSPDGSHVLTMREGSDQTDYPHAGDLFLVAVDGSGVRQLNDRSTTVAMWDRAGDPATWSPDGKSIAFAASTDYDKRKSGVYVVSADGSGLHRVGPPTRSTITARWSPDGSWIAFHEGSPVDGDLVVIRPDGSDRRVLKNTDGCCPVWSPDSRALLFLRQGAAGSELFVMMVADGSITQVTTTPGEIGAPDWVAPV